jgi:hypothetical protein
MEGEEKDKLGGYLKLKNDISECNSIEFSKFMNSKFIKNLEYLKIDLRKRRALMN